MSKIPIGSYNIGSDEEERYLSCKTKIYVIIDLCVLALTIAALVVANNQLYNCTVSFYSFFWVVLVFNMVSFVVNFISLC